MRYLVCYDITDDRRRYRVAEILKDFGPRLQESVFLADLDEALRDRMKQRLAKAVDESTDCVHVFPVCEGCWPKLWTLGRADRPQDEDFYIV